MVLLELIELQLIISNASVAAVYTLSEMTKKLKNIVKHAKVRDSDLHSRWDSCGSLEVQLLELVLSCSALILEPLELQFDMPLILYVHGIVILCRVLGSRSETTIYVCGSD